MTLNREEMAKISFLGLPKNDTAVLNSILRLWSSMLPVNYRVLDPSEQEEATLLFIDGDNPEVVSQWESIKSRKSSTTPIMVSNHEQVGDVVTLRRPLMMRHVQEALKAVSHTSRLLRQKTAYGEKLNP